MLFKRIFIVRIKIDTVQTSVNTTGFSQGSPEMWLFIIIKLLKLCFDDKEFILTFKKCSYWIDGCTALQHPKRVPIKTRCFRKYFCELVIVLSNICRIDLIFPHSKSSEHMLLFQETSTRTLPAR